MGSQIVKLANTDQEKSLVDNNWIIRFQKVSLSQIKEKLLPIIGGIDNS